MVTASDARRMIGEHCQFADHLVSRYIRLDRDRIERPALGDHRSHDLVEVAVELFAEMFGFRNPATRQ